MKGNHQEKFVKFSDPAVTAKGDARNAQPARPADALVKYRKAMQ